MRRTQTRETPITRRLALRLLGAGAAAAGAAFVAAGCGGGSRKTDDKSGGGFAKEQTARGLNAARYAESNGYVLNPFPWAIDNRGVALLGASVHSASRTSPLVLPDFIENLLFITPDGRPTPVADNARFFALSRIGDALYTDNAGRSKTTPEVPAVYLARPNSARQLVLGAPSLPEAEAFGACEISDRAQNFVVVVVAKAAADSSGVASFLLRGDSSGNLSRVADALSFGTTPPPGSSGTLVRQFGNLAVNDDGEVVFDAVRVDGSRGMYFVPVGGGGGTPVLIAATSSEGSSGEGAVDASFLRVLQITSAPSLNDNGIVAFSVLRTDNRYAVVRWRDGVFTTAAVSEPGEIYGTVSLNNAGGIAYTVNDEVFDAASVRSRVAYLPSVAESAADGITFIAQGDRFFGRKVIRPRLSGPRGLNDRLEIAISYGRLSVDGSVDDYDARAVLSVSVQTL